MKLSVKTAVTLLAAASLWPSVALADLITLDFENAAFDAFSEPWFEDGSRTQALDPAFDTFVGDFDILSPALASPGLMIGTISPEIDTELILIGDEWTGLNFVEFSHQIGDTGPILGWNDNTSVRVSEPGTLALLGAGLIALGLSRYRYENLRNKR